MDIPFAPLCGMYRRILLHVARADVGWMGCWKPPSRRVQKSDRERPISDGGDCNGSAVGSDPS